MSNTYKLQIDGKKVQNVGLRRNFHAILDKHNIDGVAVNDPYNDSVHAYISGDNTKIKKAITDLQAYIKQKTGHHISVRKRKTKDKLHPVSLTKQQLQDTANLQYLAYLMASGEVKKNEPGTGLRKAKRVLIPRFRLKDNGDTFTGLLPELGVKQIYGQAPHYKKFLKENRKVSLKQALNNMRDRDRVVVTRALNRVGKGALGE